MKKMTAHSVVVAVSFILILTTGIIFKENPLYMVPLFTSLFVMTLQARVNRWGYLLGAINCIAYAGIYWLFGAYAVALSMLLVTTPLQFATFFNWRKRELQSKELLKTMTGKQRILWGAVLVVGFAVVQTILLWAGSTVAFFDNLSMLVSTAVSLLTMFAYAEYVYLWPVSCVLSVLLQIQITMQDARQVPYLIYNLYCLYCVLVALHNVKTKHLNKAKEEPLEA